MLLPARNWPDHEDIPPSTRERLRFVWLETVEGAVAATLVTADCQHEDPT